MLKTIKGNKHKIETYFCFLKEKAFNKRKTNNDNKLKIFKISKNQRNHEITNKINGEGIIKESQLNNKLNQINKLNSQIKQKLK